MQNERNNIWTPANIVTLIRIGALPIWYICAQLASSVAVEHFCMPRVWSALLFVLISATDKLDGHLARSRNEVTVFGMFLDPIADKLLVLAGLIYLMEIGWVASWIVLVILAREFIVSGLRMVASERGVVIPAGVMGKWKTAITLISMCVSLFAYALDPSFMVWGISLYVPMELTGRILMYVAVVFTIVSGLQYIAESKKLLVDEA